MLLTQDVIRHFAARVNFNNVTAVPVQRERTRAFVKRYDGDIEKVYPRPVGSPDAE